MSENIELKDALVSCLVVLGTRPDTIKLFPVIKALQKSHIRPIVVNTGQHRDMVDPVLEMAGLKEDYDLDVSHPGQTINTLTRNVINGFDDLLNTLRGGPERRANPRLFSAAGSTSPYPAATLVHGDTTTGLAAALASAGAKVPVMHVEAGLRTGDMHSPFPEELNRQLIARIAAFHFAPTALNSQNLIREGIDSRRIFVSGNTGLDALMYAAQLDQPWDDTQLNRVDNHYGPIITVTAHRRENWGAGLRGIAEGVATVANTRRDALVIVSMHPNPLVREQLTPALSALPNVIMTEPLEYAQFARLLSLSTLVISDSGGVQEEAPTLGTPVLVTRETSERPEGVDSGTLKLVGTDAKKISHTALHLLEDKTDYDTMKNSLNPFGDGHAADRIVEAMENLIFDYPAPLPFGSGYDRRRILEAAGYAPTQVDNALAYTARLAKEKG